MKLSLVLLLSLFVLCASLALATTDPELKQCKHQCKVQRQYGAEEKRECAERCEDYYREKKRGEQERGERGEEEKRGSSRSWDEEDKWTDPQKRLRECQQQCERSQEGQQKSLCRHRCQQTYERERGREEEQPGRRERGSEDEDEDNAEQDENPYVFEEKHFTKTVDSRHGKIHVLQRFDKRSKLLRGIENYRVGIIEANPQTFVSPSHWDADGVLFVANGQGTITLIEENERKSHNVERGDVIRVRAGTSVYFINRHDNEKLIIVKFIQPVNLPGKYEAFTPAGSTQSESFYKAFSWELLEAALKTDRRKIEQAFSQKQEAIVKASKEQIQAMTHREQQEGGAIWPFKAESSSGPFNLLRKRPVKSNNYGQLFEAKPNEHKDQLKDLDLGISLANITRGSMSGPYYNSRATKIAIVLDGEGYFEMACPHVRGGGGDRSREQEKRERREQEKKEGQRFTKISSRLRSGTVFIVPAGHPVAAVASENSHLTVVCFEVNAKGNTRFSLAGKNNVVNQWEREAKELAFGVQAREIDQVFGSQDEDFFFPGPRKQQRQGRADA
ncbi:vicilin Pis v 3.0101-like [Mercurialis annua]|uniref:vicilin Pis v 3.0101-like n=1 Tax=Mercurialis annua TaxID=3986 RepID=UPI002160D76E|nr:vicilin Pis v 3.0101-like [Mercurialis annua]